MNDVVKLLLSPSTIRAALKIGGGWLGCAGMAGDGSGAEIISGALLAIVGVVWGWRSQDKAGGPPAPPAPPAAAVACFAACLCLGCSSVHLYDPTTGNPVATIRGPVMPWQSFDQIVQGVKLTSDTDKTTAEIKGVAGSSATDTNATAAAADFLGRAAAAYFGK